MLGPCSRAGAASPLAFPGVLGSCQSLGLCQSLPVAQCRPSSGLLWEMERFGHHGQGLSLGSCAGGHPRESVLLQREKRQWSWSPAGELSEILSFHGAEDVPFFCWNVLDIRVWVQLRNLDPACLCFPPYFAVFPLLVPGFQLDWFFPAL